MKEDLGKIVSKPKFESLASELSYFAIGEFSEIEAILLFIVLIPVIIAIILNLAIFFLATVLIFIAIFYWVFYRAVKFSFRQSAICKGNILKSLLYSFIFTLTYTFWFFAIILGVHYWT